MAKLPRITGEEAVATFLRAGFSIARQSSSHVILKREGCRYNLSIPVHKGKIIGRGLLKNQIDKAGITVDRFLELLQQS